MANKTRKERDAIGEVDVPADAYYGSFTARAAKNFNFEKPDGVKVLYHAYVKVKLASCRANLKCGILDSKKAKAMELSCNEMLQGKFDSSLLLNYYQAGAGTPFNMNVNEVIANRANELLGSPKGSYSPVHPNNDVNMCQSSNDVTPTAVRLALIESFPLLEAEAERLLRVLGRKSAVYSGKLKVGRTHLQDAVPIEISQELDAWAGALRRDLEGAKSAAKNLMEVPLGGTALGTGIAAHPQFATHAADELSKICGCRITSSPNKPMQISSMNAFLAYSGALRCLAVTLVKISNDLKLLVSGPNAGIAEIKLPEAEPGSSIMAGKVNPSMPEAVEIIALDAIAADRAVELACIGGQLQLNVLSPLIAKNTIEPTIDLACAIRMLDDFCVAGMEYDLPRCKAQLDSTYVFATALNMYLGYQVMAEVVKESLKSSQSIADVVVGEGLMDKDDVARLLDPKKVTVPQKVDAALAKKLQSSPAYTAFLKKIGKSVQLH